MARDYTITAVSPKVDEWQGQYGTMKTYHVKVDAHGDEVVQINKKPDSPAPQTGDTIYGDTSQSQHGLRFKSAPKQQGFGGFKADPDKQAQIKAQWAIGQAKDWTLQTTQEFGDIERSAAQFFAMVDRIKSGQLPATTGSTVVTEKKPDVVAEVPDDEINLDDIPF